MVKAKVWSTGKIVSKFGTYWLWHYAVYTENAVVLYDNTGDYQKMFTAALIRVEALRHMQIAGHKPKAYSGYIG